MTYSGVFPANATLLFGQPEPLLIVAYLRESSNSAYQLQALDAGGIGSTALSGRAIAPDRLPNTLRGGQQAECIIWAVGDAFELPVFGSIAEYEQFVLDNQSAINQQGQFFLDAGVRGVFGVEEVLGERLRGYLQSSTGWVDAG